MLSKFIGISVPNMTKDREEAALRQCPNRLGHVYVQRRLETAIRL